MMSLKTISADLYMNTFCGVSLFSDVIIKSQNSERGHRDKGKFSFDLRKT